MTDTGGRRTPGPAAGGPPPVAGAPGRPPTKGFTVPPFARLARTHALSTAGDAMVATALAGTIFFEGATSEARGKVLLYLLLTMAPFAVVAPLIGPALDRARSGRRWMIIGSMALRGAICFFMIDDVNSLLFYPEAFAVLVLQKGYAVARSAMVPSTVRDDAELVEANSKLSLLSGIMGFVGAAPAALLFKIGGPGWSLALAMVTFVAGALVGLKLTHEPTAEEPAGEAERAELRSAGVLLAASATGLLRGIVGFLTVLLAFDFRGADVPGWQFAVVAGLSLLGALVGSLVAPRLRRLVTEERILVGVLVAITGAGLVAAVLGGFRGAAVLGAVVGVASTTGKLAFDSIVQRDAPDANRGRSFARFETRFQVIWVLGAMVGLIEMPAWVGFLVVTLVAATAVFSYTVGSLAWKHRTGTRTAVTERAVVIEERIGEVQAAARLRLLRPFDPLRSRARALLPRRRTGLGTGPASPPPADGPPPASPFEEVLKPPPEGSGGAPPSSPTPFDHPGGSSLAAPGPFDQPHPRPSPEVDPLAPAPGHDAPTAPVGAPFDGAADLDDAWPTPTAPPAPPAPPGPSAEPPTAPVAAPPFGPRPDGQGEGAAPHGDGDDDPTHIWPTFGPRPEQVPGADGPTTPAPEEAPPATGSPAGHGRRR